MMAPTTKQQKEFNNFRAKLLNFSRTLPSVDGIESLMKAKDTYLNWLGDIKYFLEKEGYSEQTTTLFLDDKVVAHGMTGGAGVVFSDERSTNLINAITRETENKAIRLDKLYPLFDIKRIIEKRINEFYYNNQLIFIGKNSHPYHLLDILYNFSNNDGFISYEKIKEQFQVRKKSGTYVGSPITRRTISNAQTELFKRAYLVKTGERLKNIAPPSGKKLIDSDKKAMGLIFNNVIIS